jgi:hypothetical protein
MFLENRFPWSNRSTDTIEGLFACGVRWHESDRDRLTRARPSLRKLDDYRLRTVVSALKRAEICSSETFAELTRTPKIQKRLIGLGLIQKPLSEREKRKLELEKQQHEIARLMSRYDRVALYEQVWSEPVRNIAKSYGISGVFLGKVCRKLNVPVPPRGYWARVRNGFTSRKPSLPHELPRSCFQPRGAQRTAAALGRWPGARTGPADTIVILLYGRYDPSRSEWPSGFSAERAEAPSGVSSRAALNHRGRSVEIRRRS